MNGSVVTYTLERCVKCMRCVQACPTSALRMEDNRVIIDGHHCLNCGKCMRACHSQGLLAKGSTLEDIKNYDYTVCIVPGALISSCRSLDEAENLFYAIRELGFDEVVDFTDIEGQMMQETRILAEADEGLVISSMCPVINKLIEERYPMLVNHLAPLNYPSEIAARKIRERLKDKGDVGIFHLCECEAKLAFAKYPYLNMQYEVDHALATVDIFPLIRENLDKGRLPVTLCREGLQACNPTMMLQMPDDLIADGFDKINDILDMTEFGLLERFRILHLFPCFNGCIGGHLLWGNSYLTKNNIDALTSERRKQPSEINIEKLYSGRIISGDEDPRTLMEKLAFFQKVNEQLELLPGYDCSACGMQTCRIMAEAIVNGTKKLEDCHILHSMKEKDV
ncbi:MAG: 4Fe-4S dicluster domain-containing protein [Solobacterium sp.]|nr:4Fe-4S dicluster domain-containing protein [Solobacterium sp.]MBQ6532311.1 4Fe-4S dicluster domain-containing protein [Solobacterium sp.]MBR0214839.1 4Fe-4S dicluster domain-containing protein [Solobacterium sp.]